MSYLLRKVCAKCKVLLTHDAGQDLVEYALLALLLCLGALTSIPPLATVLATLFNSVSPGL